MNFLIGQETIEGIPVLRLIGELDVSTVPALREAMERLFAEGTNSLALDFSGVTFVDSTGLGALLGAKRRVMERSGEIYLLGTSEPLERLLQMLSLKPLFILVSDPVDLPVVAAEQAGVRRKTGEEIRGPLAQAVCPDYPSRLTPHACPSGTANGRGHASSGSAG